MATPAFRAAANAQVGTATSVTVNKPTGTASGDVLFATITVFANKTLTAPSGWTQIGSSYNGTNLWVRWYRKVAGGSEPSSYQWTWTGSTAANGSIYCWQSVDNTTPEDTTTNTSGSSSSVSIGSVTPTGTSGGIQLGLMSNFNGPYNSAPSGFTQDNTDSGASNGEDHRNATLTSGTPSGAGSQGMPSSGEWACLSIALTPTGGTTTNTRTITPVSMPLQATVTRTINPASMPLQATNTRVVPESMPVQATNTRVVTESMPLQATVTRVVPESMPLIGTQTRMVPESLPLLATNTRPVPESMPLQATQTRPVPESMPLLATLTRVIPASMPVSSGLTRVVPVSMPLLGTVTRIVPAQMPLSGAPARPLITPTGTIALGKEPLGTIGAAKAPAGTIAAAKKPQGLIVRD